MRGACSAFGAIRDSARGIAASMGRALESPLRWPRMTTRRLMMLVAIVAIGIWATMNVPPALERSVAYQNMAEYHADLERSCNEMERASSVKASAIQAQFEEWHKANPSGDELTKRYFNSHREFYETDANYQREMAKFHADLKNQYRRAGWFPWLAAVQRFIEPRHPLDSQPLASQPGKTYELVTEGAVSAQFSPRGDGLAIACRDHAIRLLQLPSRKLLASFSVIARDSHLVAFAPDRTTLFATGYAGPLQRWDLANGHADRPIAWKNHVPGQGAASEFASAMACSPDGGAIAVAVGVHTAPFSKPVYAVRLFDTRTSQRLWEHKGTGSPPRSLAYSPDGQTVAFGSGPAELLDSRTGETKLTFAPIVGHVIAVTYSPDGRTLAGAGADTLSPDLQAVGHGRVSLWDVSTGAVVRTLEGPTENAFAVVFSPDGKMLAAGGRGPRKNARNRLGVRPGSQNTSEVRAWDVASGKRIWTVEGESNAAVSLSYTMDSAFLAFCDEDYLFVIDARTGRLIQIVMQTIERFRVKG